MNTQINWNEEQRILEKRIQLAQSFLKKIEIVCSVKESYYWFVDCWFIDDLIRELKQEG